MGAGASLSILEDPFPVESGLSKDLDRLSMVAARILSTPDIYDINNLARPGVCGDYAVFLKKGIEKKLLDFTFKDTPDAAPLGIVYQNPRRAIDKPELRQKICKQIATSMVRCMSIVVACLASIQVASPSRETAVAGIHQRGGASVQDIIDWLFRNGYISSLASSATTTGEIQLDLTDRSNTAPNKPQFTIKISSTANRHGMYAASLGATGGAGYPTTGFPAMPNGTMRLEIARPVLIPGTTDALLPLRVADTTGTAWMVGVLYKDRFISMAPTAAAAGTGSGYSPFDLWHALFRLTQDRPVGTIEDRSSINAADQQFRIFRNADVSQQGLALLQVLGSTPLASIFPQAIRAAPAPAYLQPVQRTYGVFGQGLQPTFAAAPTAVYDIPLPVTKKIIDTFKLFREALPEQSSPAAVRALTLAAKVNKNRTIQTNVCRDPYWTETNLGKIYPWATLQFLCVEEYEKMSGEDPAVFGSVWKDRFVRPMKELYNGRGGLPTLTDSPKDSPYLNRLSFAPPTLPICTETITPSVDFRQVQEGLMRLRSSYAAHVKRVWEILNGLVIVIQDPDTKAEVARLHPAVLRDSSAEYIKGQAEKARALLADYYVEVERIYLETVVALKPVSA